MQHVSWEPLRFPWNLSLSGFRVLPLGQIMQGALVPGTAGCAGNGLGEGERPLKSQQAPTCSAWPELQLAASDLLLVPEWAKENHP